MLRVGLVQLRTPSTAADGLAHAAPLIREAAAAGARWVLLPEGANLLQRDRSALSIELANPEADVAVQGFRDLARELGIWLLVGSALLRGEAGEAVNRALVIDRQGRIAAIYDKLHMFDVDLPTGERHRESALYRAGDRAMIADVDGVPVGLSICYDLRFPGLYGDLARAGAKVLVIPAAFTRPTGEAHWEVLLRARAIETGAFVLAPAQGGRHEDGRATWGRSMAIDPWGRILASAADDSPQTIMAELDLGAVAAARTAIPALAHARGYIGP